MRTENCEVEEVRDNRQGYQNIQTHTVRVIVLLNYTLNIRIIFFAHFFLVFDAYFTISMEDVLSLFKLRVS